MKISTTILWIISLILAFATGFLINPTKPVPLSDTQDIDSIPLKKEMVGSSNESAEKTDSRSVATKNNSKRKIDVASTLKELLENSQMFIDLASIAESYSLVSSLSENEVIEALDQLKYGLTRTDGIPPFSILMSRYAELDAYKALSYLDNNVTSAQTKKTLTMSIISVWSKADPSSAYEWVLETNNNEQQNGLMSGFNYYPVFSGLAKQNIDDAYSKLSDLEANGQNVSMAVAGIAGTLESKEEFISFYQKSQEAESSKVGRSIVSSWASKKPREVAEWLASTEESNEKDDLQKSVLSIWMNTEPNDAADWYLASSNEKNRQAHVDNIVQRWSYRSPSSALSWAQQQSNIDVPKTTKKILDNSVVSSTKFAMENLYLLDNEKDRKELSGQIYLVLKRNNKKEADSFLNNSPFREYFIKLESNKRRK